MSLATGCPEEHPAKWQEAALSRDCAATLLRGAHSSLTGKLPYREEESSRKLLSGCGAGAYAYR
jgi:hypothetical protein